MKSRWTTNRARRPCEKRAGAIVAGCFIAGGAAVFGEPLASWPDAAPVVWTVAADGGPGGRMDEFELAQMATTRGEVTSADRWEKFEADFGIPAHHPSVALGVVQKLKYQLDKTVFTILEMEEQIEDAIEFEYSLDRSQPQQPTKPGNRSRGPRFRSELDINSLRGELYIGVRLVLPFD
jgi:hypothetical protein